MHSGALVFVEARNYSVILLSSLLVPWHCDQAKSLEGAELLFYYQINGAGIKKHQK